MKISAQCVANPVPVLLYQTDFIQTLEITHFIICNGEGSPNTISVFVVPAGATPGINNAMLYQYKLASNDLIELETVGGMFLTPRQSIYVSSTDPNFVVAFLCGELNAQN